MKTSPQLAEAKKQHRVRVMYRSRLYLDITFVERRQHQRFPVWIDVYVLPTKVVHAFKHAVFSGIVMLVAIRIQTCLLSIIQNLSTAQTSALRV